MSETQKQLLLLLARYQLDNLQALDNEVINKSSQVEELRIAMSAVEQEGQ